MKYVIFYWSRFGHNKKIANLLSEKLSKKGETKVFNTEDIEPNKIPDADLYVFSGSAEAFRLEKNMRKFMKKLKDVSGKKYAIINTHGMKKNWLKSMDKILSKKDMEKVAEIDFRITSEGQKQGKGFVDKNWGEKIDSFSKEL